MPDLLGGEWLISDLFKLGPVSTGGMELSGVSWREIESWSRMTRTEIEAWEVEALHKMSAAYASAYSASQEPDRKAYWVGDQVAHALNAQVEQASTSLETIFGALAQRNNPGPADGA